MMRILTLILYLLLSFMIGCDGEQHIKEYGEALPFALYDTDSTLHVLKDYTGKPFMIHFWADWCPHCREEFPKLQRAYEVLKPEGFEFIAINSGQTREHVQEIKDTYNLTFPLLVDEEAKVAGRYKVAGLPTSYFVDSHGVIKEVIVSWLKEEQILASMRKLK